MNLVVAGKCELCVRELGVQFIGIRELGVQFMGIRERDVKYSIQTNEIENLR